MNNKKLIPICGLAATLLLSLTACPIIVKRELVLWTNCDANYLATLEEALDFLNKGNKEFHTTVERHVCSNPDFYKIIYKSIPAGTGPDIIITNSSVIADLAGDELLYPISNYPDKEEAFSEDDKKDIADIFLNWKENYPNEIGYGLPLDKDVSVMLYNSAVLNGLDLSSINPTINGGKPLDKEYLSNLTWVEMFENLCPTLVDYNNTLDAENKIISVSDDASKQVQNIIECSRLSELFTNMYYQSNHEFITYTDEGTAVDFNPVVTTGMLATLNYASSMHYIGKSNPTIWDKDPLFRITSISGCYNEIKNIDELEATFIPQTRTDKKKTFVFGQEMAIIKSSDSKFDSDKGYETFKLYKVLTDTLRGADFASIHNTLPIRKSSVDSYSFTPDVKLVKKQATDVRPYLDKTINDYKASVYDTLFSICLAPKYSTILTEVIDLTEFALNTRLLSEEEINNEIALTINRISEQL